MTKTKLSPECAVAQIARMQLLRGFPDNPKTLEALSELLTKWFTGGRR